MPKINIFCVYFPVKKVLREDIVAHDQPISKNVNDIAILLREFGGKLKPEDESFLRSGLDELKPRYDEVNKQSITRQNKLDSSLDDLEKYREEFEEFEEWLKEAERSNETIQRAPGRDLQALKKQVEEEKRIMEEVSDHKGDLKFIQRSGHKFLDNARVSPINFNNFNHLQFL